jgi:hypothetical protein
MISPWLPRVLRILIIIFLSLFITGFLFLLDWLFRRDIIKARKVCRGE